MVTPICQASLTVERYFAVLQCCVDTCQENGILSSTTVTEVSGVVEDMLTVSTEAGEMLEYGPAVSLLQVRGSVCLRVSERKHDEPRYDSQV